MSEPEQAEPSSPDAEPPSASVADATDALDAATRAWLADHAEAVLRRLGARGEVRVRLVGDDEMARVHERWAGVPGTTDVLTFDLADGPGLDTDLYVCVDEARRQAEARSHALEHEILLYVVHGVLHCLGYDDHDEDEAERMHHREDEVLAAIGVGRVYAEDGS